MFQGVFKRAGHRALIEAVNSVLPEIITEVAEKITQWMVRAKLDEVEEIANRFQKAALGRAFRRAVVAAKNDGADPIGADRP